MTNQQIQYWSLQEVKRHNEAQESLGQKSLGETIRHDIVSENLGYSNLAEQRRHSIVTEQEVQRHNMATESLTQQQIGLGYAQLSETKRMNNITAKNMAGQLKVSQWNSTAQLYNAMTSRRQQEETVRHNMNQEQIEAAHELVNIGTTLLKVGAAI